MCYDEGRAIEKPSHLAALITRRSPGQSRVALLKMESQYLTRAFHLGSWQSMPLALCATPFGGIVGTNPDTKASAGLM